MSMIMSQTYCPKAYKFDAYVLPVAERIVGVTTSSWNLITNSNEPIGSSVFSFYPNMNCIRPY